MWLRLRQIALVAEKLAPVEREFADVLGIKVGYRDPGVGHFGLENALMPIGNQLLEVVAPIQENTAGGRYLTRRGGDGGYMVITQCDDHAPRRARVEALGVRIVNQFDSGEFSNMQLHPKDTGGSFFEIDEQRGERAHDADGPWEPAGAELARPSALGARHRHRRGGSAVRRPRRRGRPLVGDRPDRPRRRRPAHPAVGQRRGSLRTLHGRPSRGLGRHRRGLRRPASGVASRRGPQRPNRG